MFDTGDKVKTSLGPGTVVWKRMRSTTFTEVECYSVCLDSKKAAMLVPPFPSYTGTVFPAEEVQEL